MLLNLTQEVDTTTAMGTPGMKTWGDMGHTGLGVVGVKWGA